VTRRLNCHLRDRVQNAPPTMTDSITTEVKFDENGLAPAIVQDHATGEVLMLAYMNRESLSKTIESGETWFWSRSRSQLWHKGETSGNTQRVISIALDCDGDTLLIRVEPRGPACHTGARSCFFRTI
jgi:phosphoribosyl-AMP cyclohydrolase / phosphoribosyl-ATP pyrophosphohydrolase